MIRFLRIVSCVVTMMLMLSIPAFAVEGDPAPSTDSIADAAVVAGADDGSGPSASGELASGGDTIIDFPTQMDVQLLPRLLMDTPLAEYSVTEGLLLCIFVLGVLSLLINFFKGVWSVWL